MNCVTETCLSVDSSVSSEQQLFFEIVQYSDKFVHGIELHSVVFSIVLSLLIYC